MAVSYLVERYLALVARYESATEPDDVLIVKLDNCWRELSPEDVATVSRMLAQRQKK